MQQKDIKSQQTILYLVTVPLKRHPKLQLQHYSWFPKLLVFFMPLSVYNLPMGVFP